MIVTPFGIRLPETGEKNWWSQIIFNLVRISAHTHDGVDSSLLPSTSFTKTKQNLSFTDWEADGATGNYKRTVTMPAGISFENHAPLFFMDGAGGQQLMLDYTRLDDTSFELYTNNNSLSIRVLYV